MARVQLVKGRSYKGLVKVTAENPYAEVADKKTVDALIATGRFVLIGDSAENSSAITLETMSAAQLDAYAVENEIDLAGCRTKADKIERIRLFESSNIGGDDDDELDFGEAD